MAFLSDNVFDDGLQYITDNGSRMDICTSEPANYTEATSTYTCGNKTSLTAGAPENGDVSGRKVVIPAITDGSITATATAAFWAYSKTTATTELLGASALGGTQAVTSGNSFSLGATGIGMTDPA